MDRYVVTFYLGLGIGVIGPAFDISIGIWVPYSLLFGASIESRNRFYCPFDIIDSKASSR